MTFDLLCGRYMGNSEPKQLEQNRIFNVLSKHVFFLACNFFLLEGLWFVEGPLTCWEISEQPSWHGSFTPYHHDCSAGYGTRGIFWGASWGSATDSHRVYTNIINNEAKNFTLVPSKNVMQNRGWVGIDASNGTTLRTTATPCAIGNFPTRAVSVANGVFFTTSYGSFNGSIYVLDTKTCRVL